MGSEKEPAIREKWEFVERGSTGGQRGVTLGAPVPTPAPKSVAQGWGRQQDVPRGVQASGPPTWG